MTFIFILIGGLIALVAGLSVKTVFDRTSLRGEGSISRLELVIGTVLCTLVVVPTVTSIGFAIARANAATYHEYYSGLEKRADVTVTTCTRDGSCRHTYQCDPYLATETYYVTETYTKADGSTGSRSVRKTRTVTKYHQCPYVTEEYTFTVSDTMGETYTLGNHWFPSDPEKHLWRPGDFSGFLSESLPAVPTGEPGPWRAAKARIESGNPGGTTKRHDYKNYILASKDDIYAKASNAIGDYLDENLLPKVTTTVYDAYLAQKVYFVGPPPTGTRTSVWQESLMRLNGNVGGQRQGDVHLVVVTDPRVLAEPDRYTQALDAYWQSEALGKDTLSKNGIGVVIGVSDTPPNEGITAPGAPTIAWARGFTGMPLGNEALVQDFSNLAGNDADPATFLAVDGPLGSMLLADGAGFNRVEMADYQYLYAEIQPGTGARVLVLLIGFVLSLFVWAGMLAAELALPKQWVEAVRRAKTDRARAGRAEAENAETTSSALGEI